MTVISDVLYWISTGLLVPVIILLIFFFIRALILIGAFYGQYVTQKKVEKEYGKKIEGLTPESLSEFSDTLPANSDSIFVAYLKKIIAERGNAPRMELLLSDYEMEADKNISTSKILTKMGPILGLMGTLIPMGPALVGLATGDIASMAYNMQVAFATTVVGLVVSAIGFLTQHVKERWAISNVTLLEYLVEVIKQTSK